MLGENSRNGKSREAKSPQNLEAIKAEVFYSVFYSTYGVCLNMLGENIRNGESQEVKSPQNLEEIKAEKFLFRFLFRLRQLLKWERREH